MAGFCIKAIQPFAFPSPTFYLCPYISPSAPSGGVREVVGINAFISCHRGVRGKGSGEKSPCYITRTAASNTQTRTVTITNSVVVALKFDTYVRTITSPVQVVD